MHMVARAVTFVRGLGSRPGCRACRLVVGSMRPGDARGSASQGGQHRRRTRQGPTAPAVTRELKQGKTMPAVAPATPVRGREPDPRAGADKDNLAGGHGDEAAVAGQGCRHKRSTHDEG